MAVSNTLTVLLLSLIICIQGLEQRPSLGSRSKRDTLASSMFSAFTNLEKRLAAVEATAQCDNSTEERVVQLEAEMTKLQEKMSALDKRLEDISINAVNLHNSSMLAIQGIVHTAAASEQSFKATMRSATEVMVSMMSSSETRLLAIAEKNAAMFNASIARVEQTTKELATRMSAVEKVTERMAASEQIMSSMQNATEFLASMMNDTKTQLLTRTVDNIAMFNASIAQMKQTTKELATRMSALENEVHSGSERMAASEQSLKSTMRNATENLASMMDDTKAQLLARAKDNAAVFNTSIARVEQSTKTLTTNVSAVRNKLDNASSLCTEEVKKTRLMLEQIKNITEELGISLQYRRTCQAYYDDGQRTSGVYNLQLHCGGSLMKVYCDMNNGTGWVVFQRRQDGSVDFYRNWTSYEEGFGDLNGEFWLGNRNIHRLTSAGLTQLRVDLQAWNGSTAFAFYSHFSVGNTSSSYTLSVSGYSGTAGDSLAPHSGQKFSTFDRDLDTWSSNCAQTWKGGWWYHSCHNSNMNGQYGTRGSSDYQYVMWEHWLGTQSLQRTEMKLI